MLMLIMHSPATRRSSNCLELFAQLVAVAVVAAVAAVAAVAVVVAAAAGAVASA